MESQTIFPAKTQAEIFSIESPPRALEDPDGDEDVAWLRAVVAGPCAGRQAEARRRLARLLHSRPDRAGLWRAAAKFVI